MDESGYVIGGLILLQIYRISSALINLSVCFLGERLSIRTGVRCSVDSVVVLVELHMCL